MTTEIEPVGVDHDTPPDQTEKSLDAVLARFVGGIKITDQNKFETVLNDKCNTLALAVSHLLTANETKVFIKDQAVTGQQLAHEIIARAMAGELVNRIPVSQEKIDPDNLPAQVWKKVQNLAAAVTEEEAQELVNRYSAIAFPGLPFDVQFELFGFARLPREQKTLSQMLSVLESATQQLNAIEHNEMVKKDEANLGQTYETLSTLIRDMEPLAPLYTQIIKDTNSFQQHLGQHITRKYDILTSCYYSILPIFQSVGALVRGKFTSVEELKALLKTSGPVTLGRKQENKAIKLGFSCKYLLHALEEQEVYIRQNFPYNQTREEQEKFLEKNLRFFSQAVGEINNPNRLNLRHKVMDLFMAEFGRFSTEVVGQDPDELEFPQD